MPIEYESDAIKLNGLHFMWGIALRKHLIHCIERRKRCPVSNECDYKSDFKQQLAAKVML